MQFLVLAVIIASTFASYLTELHVAPTPVKFLPEVLSLLVALCVLALGARERFRLVAAHYWVTFAAAGAVILAGVLTNAVAPGTFIGGLRYCVRALPLFLLPAVWDFREEQVRAQLRVILGIALLQVPISLYQRHLVTERGHWSGDSVYGTLMISSAMSIFLIAVMCVAAGFAVRQRLSKLAFLLLFAALVVPTTINETKSTVLLLPIGLVATLAVGAPSGRRLRVAGSALGLFALFGALYIPVYDYYASLNNPYPYTVEKFFGNRSTVQDYVDQQTDLGSRREAGRWDALEVPLETFASDPVHLMFGVGLGNGSPSSLGPSFTGQYYVLFGRYTIETSAAAFIVEMGVLGLGLALALYYLILRDSLVVARRDESLVGALAVGWIGVTLVMVLATFYKAVHLFESLTYLYAYLSGLIAAQRMRLALATQARPVPATRVQPAARPATAAPRARSGGFSAGQPVPTDSDRAR
jgi:hypothetical protein